MNRTRAGNLSAFWLAGLASLLTDCLVILLGPEVLERRTAPEHRLPPYRVYRRNRHNQRQLPTFQLETGKRRIVAHGIRVTKTPSIN